MKLEAYPYENGTAYLFQCPGCKFMHQFVVNSTRANNWEFNNDLNYPTFSPSLLVRWNTDGSSNLTHICHSFVKEGKIQFLSDCTHDLKNQTVNLFDI